IFNRAKLDLLHVPHFNVPVLYRRPFVVTIHDLILNQFPTERASTLGPLLFRAKFIVYQFIVRQAITRSAAIITVSENSKRELTERYHQSPTKITVTYESVDPLSPAVPIDVLRPRGIHRPYILYVGNAYPHKNLERLLDASKIARQQGEEFQVVLVGKRDYFSRRLEAYAKEQGMNHVIFFGFASDAELSALYTQAIAYFFPSLSEGFGLPGLEAMQAGVPVWASNASCLPEVFGPAARYFDPHDTASIAASIETALHDTLRSAMITAGFDRLQRFSWAAMAKQTLTVYQEVYARSQKKKSHS
ncbi:MAG: glycosyltransferase family 4 protein, partial [Candidatus Kerfeldbacteria bacterium]|nr:glycosyltransferase family 4 protein [Candidatus Kerfeldbacteria bacterium]